MATAVGNVKEPFADIVTSSAALCTWTLALAARPMNVPPTVYLALLPPLLLEEELEDPDDEPLPLDDELLLEEELATPDEELLPLDEELLLDEEEELLLDELLELLPEELLPEELSSDEFPPPQAASARVAATTNVITGRFNCLKLFSLINQICPEGLHQTQSSLDRL